MNNASWDFRCCHCQKRQHADTSSLLRKGVIQCKKWCVCFKVPILAALKQSWHFFFRLATFGRGHIPPLIFMKTSDNTGIWILKLKTMYIQAFLFNDRTSLLIDTHTYIDISNWTSTGFSRTRTAPKPGPSSGPVDKHHTPSQVSSKNPGNLLNPVCSEKSLDQGNYLNWKGIIWKGQSYAKVRINNWMAWRITSWCTDLQPKLCFLQEK